MNKFTNDVLKTIDKFGMIPEGTTVVAAVSGGYDSLCMLYVLSELRALRKFSLCVAHLNHLLREDADGDEVFVTELCKKLEIASYTKKADISALAAAKNISVEAAGRAARYEFFDEIMDKIPNSVTATAHNANDSAESFMMHLLRGGGCSSLTGIKAKRGRIIRPLIERTRQEIEQYCKDKGITPRVDYTNFDDSYTRNDIRHNVMPPIISRGGVEAIARTAGILAEEDEFLSDYAANLAKQYITENGGDIVIDAKVVSSLPTAIGRRLIRYALGERGRDISLFHTESVLSLARNNYGGKYTVLPGGITARLEKGKLIIKISCV
ncbi:MAG: tRNA(Ile)-lysidine synthase [Firmicutes bacterium ADurb.Bin193]|nr:MAG: tRNA(Ile)-lysidine synthase [Firmicutes bacterium ADurb.Bin193]